MWHVHRRAAEASCIDEVHIATESHEIADVCREFSISCLMTSDKHLTGTDRVAECANALDADIIVNVQGDEPFIQPASIDKVTRALIDSDDPGLAATNGFERIEGEEEVHDQSAVKVVFSVSGNALAFSRLPIPASFRSSGSHFRQLGLYAFRRKSLEFFSRTGQGPVEMAESVEMYRFIEHDKVVRMIEVERSGIAVDTPADLYQARLHYDKLGAQ